MERPTLPVVFVELPACPACDSVQLNCSGGTQQQGDGSKLQYARCLECGSRFKVVWEIPLNGMDTEALS